MMKNNFWCLFYGDSLLFCFKIFITTLIEYTKIVRIGEKISKVVIGKIFFSHMLNFLSACGQKI